MRASRADFYRPASGLGRTSVPGSVTATELAFVVAAPSEDGSVEAKGHAERIARRNSFNAAETLDALGVRSPWRLGVTQLPTVVRTPRIDVTPGVNDEAVVQAA
jgi:hypothetical protein